MTMPLLACLHLLRHQFPNSKILFLGNKSVDFSLRVILELGAHGFVRYIDAMQSLPRAIHAVVANQHWFPPEFTRKVKQPEERWHSLTERERLIVRLLERRLANKEIARLLRISTNTIKFHLSNLFRKLGVHNRHEVIVASALQQLQGELNNSVSVPLPLDQASHSYGQKLTEPMEEGEK